MKPWINDFVKNSTVAELTIIDPTGQPITVSMKSHFSDGLIFLQPAIEFGGLPVKIQNNQRGSLFFGEIFLNDNKNVLLQGQIEIIAISEYQSITKQVSNEQIAIKFKTCKVFAIDTGEDEGKLDEFEMELVL